MTEKSEKTINITSTVIESGLDAAKNFLGKLIMPAVEETGLLIKDQVTLWKFKNQVRMLNKAKAFCEQNKISPKQISLKLLCPLLEYSGLEEDEVLHDKWAILLTNMVDSEQNIENHVFPYILSQLSSNEFLALEKVFQEKEYRVQKLMNELNDYNNTSAALAQGLKDKISEIESQIAEIKKTSNRQFNKDIWELENTKRKIDKELILLKTKGYTLQHSIDKLENLSYNCLKDFELSNVIRLGLVKEEKEFYANSQTLEIPNDRDDESRYINVDLDIEVESDTNNVLTELGELFMNACRIKQEKNNR